jgi:hypothetical protein
MAAHKELTRRRLLGDGARLTAAAFASTLMPPNIRRALAATPAAGPAGTLRDVKHVVPADAGEPVVRPLLRHDGGRPRIWRCRVNAVRARQVGIPPA